MINKEVVAYLQAHMGNFAIDDLRRQLAEEGISDLEFDEALKAAQRMPPLPAESRSSKAGLVFLCAGVGLVIVAALVAVFRAPPAAPAAPAAAQAAPSAPEESGFIGHYGYVIRLPQGYSATQSFKDEKKTVEIVHFCKTGTDPTNFQDHDLYGQLGIVRLEVSPNPFAGSMQGLETLNQVVTQKAQQRAEKFHINNPQVSKKSTLPGIELIVETPFPRLEAYFLGEKVLYTFTAGQDDEIYRGIVTSLRETQSSN